MDSLLPPPGVPTPRDSAAAVTPLPPDPAAQAAARYAAAHAPMLVHAATADVPARALAGIAPQRALAAAQAAAAAAAAATAQAALSYDPAHLALAQAHAQAHAAALAQAHAYAQQHQLAAVSHQHAQHAQHAQLAQLAHQRYQLQQQPLPPHPPLPHQPPRPPQPPQQAVSFQASEFVAFAVHKLWHRLPGVRRQQTMPARTAQAAAGALPTLPESPAADPADAPASERGSPAHLPAPAATTQHPSHAAQQPTSQAQAALNPPLPAQHPQDAHNQLQQHPHQPQLPARAAPAPFNAVVCPPGTRKWYPAFFEAVHTVLSRSACTLPHILIALLYVARLRQMVPPSVTGEGSEYRVFVSALILAQKFHSDDRYSNKAWSKITRLPLHEINTMEREFLASIQGRLHVRDTEYAKWEETIRALGQEHTVALAAAALHHNEEAARAALAASGAEATPMDVFEDGAASAPRRFHTVPRNMPSLS
ncbi:hypothetical protein HK105_200143 [Polyrhizophydium stewartii]|uniref:Cyclin N-terminal domain-containing protein n=1 Tax=Polyrhizophydium stewartii TaxID=2732419 RepID=A0ABR4NKM6_9FUNG